jgi:hypothetical protein
MLLQNCLKQADQQKPEGLAEIISVQVFYYFNLKVAKMTACK